MIQFKLRANSLEAFSNSFDVNLYDKFNDKVNIHRPLITFKSQFTDNSKTVSANIVSTDKERYMRLGVTTAQAAGFENLPNGVIQLGTTNFPLGFYDATIYENTSTENMDTTGLNIVYYGVMNLEITEGAVEPSVPPVVYNEYTTNDTDTEAVYVTSAGAY